MPFCKKREDCPKFLPLKDGGCYSLMCFKMCESPQAAGDKCSAELACSATALRNLKTEVIEMVRSTELDDGQELCLKSQELIVGWLESFFENKIFDEGLKQHNAANNQRPQELNRE